MIAYVALGLAAVTVVVVALLYRRIDQTSEQACGRQAERRGIASALGDRAPQGATDRLTALEGEKVGGDSPGQTSGR